MDVRYNGLSASLFVDKGTEVDVVPSMLKGWLELGGSRVVRASGVDLDIGMKHVVNMVSNLKTLKLERIIDTYDGTDVSSYASFLLLCFISTGEPLFSFSSEFAPGSPHRHVPLL